MALKCTVKISTVNNLSDARYVAGMGVDMMGFQVDPQSENYISPEQFAAITGWVSGVKLVAELDRLSSGMQTELLDQYAIDAIQVAHPHKSNLNDLSLPLIISLTDADEELIQTTLREYKDVAAYFLLDYTRSITPVEITGILHWAQEYPLLLGGEFTPEEVMTWIDEGLTGIALKGGDEIKPGYKDFDGLAEMLEALEIDDLD